MNKKVLENIISEVLLEVKAVSKEEIIPILPVLKKMSMMTYAQLGKVFQEMDKEALQKLSKALKKIRYGVQGAVAYHKRHEADLSAKQAQENMTGAKARKWLLKAINGEYQWFNEQEWQQFEAAENYAVQQWTDKEKNLYFDNYKMLHEKFEGASWTADLTDDELDEAWRTCKKLMDKLK